MRFVRLGTAALYPLWLGAFQFTLWAEADSKHTPAATRILAILLVVLVFGFLAAIALAWPYRAQARPNGKQVLFGMVVVVVWLIAAISVLAFLYASRLIPTTPSDVSYVAWQFGSSMVALTGPLLIIGIASRLVPSDSADATLSRAPGPPPA